MHVKMHCFPSELREKERQACICLASVWIPYSCSTDQYFYNIPKIFSSTKHRKNGCYLYRCLHDKLPYMFTRVDIEIECQNIGHAVTCYSFRERQQIRKRPIIGKISTTVVNRDYLFVMLCFIAFMYGPLSRYDHRVFPTLNDNTSFFKQLEVLLCVFCRSDEDTCLSNLSSNIYILLQVVVL